MRCLTVVGLCVSCLAGATRAAEEPAANAGDAPPAPGAAQLTVIRDATPVMFGSQKIGELAEGTKLKRLQVLKTWSKVRITFGKNWVEGWVSTSATVPDSLKGVTIDVRSSPRRDTLGSYRVPGKQFVEVRVRLRATDKGPSRVYFQWADEETADLYLKYRRRGREWRILPYGFWRAKPGKTLTYSRRAKRFVDATLERVEKSQTLSLKPDSELVVGYIFSVPIEVRTLDIRLKDQERRIGSR